MSEHFVDPRLAPAAVSERIEAIAALCAAWRADGCDEFEQAVGGRDEIREQLRRIAAWDVSTLTRLLHDELGADLQLVRAPNRILHLAAGSVPGLLIDSLLPTLALGSEAILRPSRDDHETKHFVQLMHRETPELAAGISIVETIVWDQPDAAVVFGDDKTIALVRHKLGQSAPVAAYGSRTSIAVATDAGLASADLSTTADALRTDVTTFDARGCMSPRTLVTFGKPPAELADACAELTLDHRCITTVAELADVCSQLAAPLQTATLLCSANERPELEAALIGCGALRICPFGEAHTPPIGGRHDGRGRLIDLVRWVERT